MVNYALATSREPSDIASARVVDRRLIAGGLAADDVAYGIVGRDRPVGC